jgi:RNA-directed DNA polymerase
MCRIDLFNGEPLDVHHLVPVADGGTNGLSNLVLCHEACHYNAQGRKTHALQRF